MVFAPRDKSFEGLLKDMLFRLSLVERRLGRGSSSGDGSTSDPPRGSTSRRDNQYGVPSTDDQRAALANAIPIWFNTDKGWTEVYYATTGTPGLTVRGLLAGHPSGWYPQPGAGLIARRGKTDGYQNLPGGAVAADVILASMDINRGGFVNSGTSGIAVPYGGRYQVHASVYYTGGTAVNAVQWARVVNDGAIAADHISQRPTGALDQMEQVTRMTTVLPGKVLALVAMTQASNNAAYGTNGLQTWIEVQYLGPPLTNG